MIFFFYEYKRIDKNGENMIMSMRGLFFEGNKK